MCIIQELNRTLTGWQIHPSMNPPCRPSQAEFTHHSSSINSTCVLSVLPNTLCKINHTLNTVNRLWNESGEREVRFLYTRCRRINKYKACLPLYLWIWMIVHVAICECKLRLENRKRWQTPTSTWGPDSSNKFAPDEFWRVLGEKTHIISLSAWVCPHCMELPANLITCFRYAGDCSTLS